MHHQDITQQLFTIITLVICLLLTMVTKFDMKSNMLSWFNQQPNLQVKQLQAGKLI